MSVANFAIVTMRHLEPFYETGRIAPPLVSLRPPAWQARLLIWLLSGLLAAATCPAFAQTQTTPGERATNLPDPLEEPELDDVRFAIGMAGSISPNYSGSSKIGFAIAPAARLVWRGYSISTSSVARASASAGSDRSAETGLTGPLYRTNEFAFGFGASLNRGRNISEEDARLGLKDLPGTLIGRLRMRYYFTPNLVMTTTLVGDLLGRQQGIELPIGIGWRRSLAPGLLFSSDLGLTIADDKSLDNNYGIGPTEQAASGLPLYHPSAGVREVSGSLGLVGEPTEHWVWVARLSLVKLVGPAARSPIVKQTLQPALLVGFAYRFSLH